MADLKLASGAQAPRAPTMVELLTHTSGLRSDVVPGGRPWFAGWAAGQALASVEDRCTTEFPLKAVPGCRFAYSSIGTDVAARVAEVAPRITACLPSE